MITTPSTKTAHPLTALLAVEPGEDENQGEPQSQQGLSTADESRRESPRLRDHVHHLDGHPCPGDVRERPLEDLALLQAIEEGIHATDSF